MTKYLEFDTPAVKQSGDLASEYGLDPRDPQILTAE